MAHQDYDRHERTEFDRPVRPFYSWISVWLVLLGICLVVCDLWPWITVDRHKKAVRGICQTGGSATEARDRLKAAGYHCTLGPGRTSTWDPGSSRSIMVPVQLL